MIFGPLLPEACNIFEVRASWLVRFWLGALWLVVLDLRAFWLVKLVVQWLLLRLKTQPPVGTDGKPAAAVPPNKICDSQPFQFSMIFGPLLPEACGIFEVRASWLVMFWVGALWLVIMDLRALWLVKIVVQWSLLRLKTQPPVGTDGKPAAALPPNKICDSQPFQFSMIFGPLLPEACGIFEVGALLLVWVCLRCHFDGCSVI
jgi:hypothetical protein